MKANLFRELSNNNTIIEIEEGRTIKESVPFNLENSIIIVNGKPSDQNHVVRCGDVITIRLVPGVIGGLIALGVALVAVAIVGGIAAYKMKKANQRAQEELDKIKNFSNNPDVDNRPFLRGASNTVATGKSQPYVIGRHFFTPYLLSKPFYRLSGTDGATQYVYTVLECGFAKQILENVSIDDITLKKFSDKEPQDGAFDIDKGIFAEDGRIEVVQDGGNFGELLELNYKYVSENRNDQIPYDKKVHDGEASYLTYTLNKCAMDVDVAITFPYGLYAMNDDGGKTSTKIKITPQYSLDGGKTFEAFTFDNNGTHTNEFERKEATKELRFVAHKDFSKSDYDILKGNGQSAIVIRLLNNGSEDSMIKNDCYCLYYQSRCFDLDKSTDSLVPCKVVEDRERKYCTMLGLRLKSSASNEDKLKKINVITQGVARTWNGEEWSEEKTETRNPAAWALEIETSDTHPASRYSDDELDLESFGEFYEFCEEMGYKFDMVVTQGKKKDDILDLIMEATGACIYTDIFGRRAVAIDRPKENALAVYNPQNIIKITNKKTFGKRTDALRVKYTSSADDVFQEDTYTVMREVDGVPLELNEDSIIKEVTVSGVTEHQHIVKYARRLMAAEALRTKTTTIEVGNEGIFYTPYSKVLIQDDSLKIGIGKGHIIKNVVWKNGLLKRIDIDSEIEFDGTKSYGIVVNCISGNGTKPICLKVEGSGKTSELLILTQLRASADFIPERNAVLSFGELDSDGEFSKVTSEFLISSIKRNEKGFTLELVDYSEAMYETGTIPEYKSNITPRKSSSVMQIPSESVSMSDVQNQISTIVERIDPSGSNAAQEAANEVVHGVHFTNMHRIRDMELSLEEILAKIDSDAADARAGISVSEDEILMKVADIDDRFFSEIRMTKDEILENVADTESGLRSAIDIKADEIAELVADLEKETQALIDIQSTEIAALVEGGGASGRLSLSLELPAMIDESTRAKMVAASSEDMVSAVYARLDGTEFYSIKGNTSQSAVKALWDKAVAANLIASQIDLSATQIHIDAKNIQIDGETIIDNAKKIKADFIDVNTLLGNNATFKGIVEISSGGYLRLPVYDTEPDFNVDGDTFILTR